MAEWIIDAVHERRGGRPGRALVLGLTFKENVPDLRNSRSFDLIERLRELGYEVDVADPIADAVELEAEQGLKMAAMNGRYDLVVGAVAHDAYRALSEDELQALLQPDGMLADIKGMWREVKLNPSIDRWTL